MRFLRTASTGRLLGVIAGLIVAVGGGTAIAVAATSGGAVPKARPLAGAVHAALTATPVTGVFAHITFTNGLISSSDFTGDARDPLLQGATGRIWIADDGRLRLELQTSNGDAQVLVDKGSFWISDPRTQTLYEGTLPSGGAGGAAGGKASAKSQHDAVPTIAQLQADINRLMTHVDLGGARTSDPTDVAGRPAYSVVVAPKHSGGLLGQAKLAWDAFTGVPLDVAVYARGNANPVLELKANDIKYGASAVAGAFDITPPSNYQVVKVATGGAGNPTAPMGAEHKAKPITGLANVQSHVAFKLAAPATLVGLPRHDVRLLDWGGTPTALITYGQNLGGIVVLEHRESSTTTGSGQGSQPNGRSAGGLGGLALPSVNINGATGTELSTPLGTVLSYSPAKSGVAYTLLGSVPAAAAEAAARALTP